MLLPLLLKREERTLTRFLVSGKPRQLMLLLRMRLLSSLTLSRGKTRILLMKSRISLTSLEMVDAPSMTWTNSAEDLNRRRKSFRELLKRLRVLLSKRKTRSSELSLNLAKFARKLIGESLRRKKSSTIPVRTTSVPWNPWVPLLRQNRELKLRLSALRRNLKEISMSLKLDLIMPTRPMLRV